MSVKASAWVWQQPIKGTQKLVLLALSDCANDDGKCWPGIKTVAKKCGIGRNTAIDNIRKLKKQGLILSERRYTESGRRTSNLYTLCLSPESVRTEYLRTDKSTLSPISEPESLYKHQLKEGEESPSVNPKDIVWQEGVKLGVTRTLLGKLCKEHTTVAVAQAVLKTKEHAPAEPKSYIIGILKSQDSDPFTGAI